MPDGVECRRYPPENKFMMSDNIKIPMTVSVMFRTTQENLWCGEYLSREEME
jgi:hypothetical protein